MITSTRRALAATLGALPLAAQAPAAAPPLRLADPSAVFCVERLGGRFEIERGPAGERGVCVLPDGRRVDAWALFRAHHGEPPPGATAPPPGGR